MDVEILTVEDVAARLKVKRSWVYSHKYHLGAYKIGKYIRFSWPRVLEHIERVDSLESKNNDANRIFQPQGAPRH